MVHTYCIMTWKFKLQNILGKNSTDHPPSLSNWQLCISNYTKQNRVLHHSFKYCLAFGFQSRTSNSFDSLKLGVFVSLCIQFTQFILSVQPDIHRALSFANGIILRQEHCKRLRLPTTPLVCALNITNFFLGQVCSTWCDHLWLINLN